MIKEEWLDNVVSVADVALLSYEGYTVSCGMEETVRNTKIDVGAGRILLEGKYLFDIIDDHMDMNRYKVIILPDLERLTPQLKDKLDDFLSKGGKLLATGKSGLYVDRDEFAFDFGADYIEPSRYIPNYIRPLFEMEGLYDSSYVMYSQGEIVTLSTEGTMLAKQENPYFNRTSEHFCSHMHAPNSWELGGPGITEGMDGIYIGWQVFSEYAEKGSLILKRIVQYALDRLLGESKTLKINLGAQGITTLMQQKGRYVHHLLYGVPVKRGSGVEIIEDIMPVYDVQVELKVPEKIQKVYLAPQCKEISFTQNNYSIIYTVEKVDCHQMIVLEY